MTPIRALSGCVFTLLLLSGIHTAMADTGPWQPLHLPILASHILAVEELEDQFLVVERSSILRTHDGLSWEVAWMPDTSEGIAQAASLDNGYFLVVEGTGGVRVVGSADGHEWTERVSAPEWSFSSVLESQSTKNRRYELIQWDDEEGQVSARQWLQTEDGGESWFFTPVSLDLDARGWVSGNGMRLRIQTIMGSPPSEENPKGTATSTRVERLLPNGEIEEIAQIPDGLRDMVFGNGVFCATVYGIRFWVSEDGVNWTMAEGVGIGPISKFLYSNGYFLLTSKYKVPPTFEEISRVLFSSDGLVWQEVPNAAEADLYLAGPVSTWGDEQVQIRLPLLTQESEMWFGPVGGELQREAVFGLRATSLHANHAGWMAHLHNQVFFRYREQSPLSPPQNLLLRSVGEDTVRIFWEEVASAESYEVYQFTGLPSVGETVIGTLLGATEDTEIELSGLEEGSMGIYYIVAIDSEGNPGLPSRYSSHTFRKPRQTYPLTLFDGLVNNTGFDSLILVFPSFTTGEPRPSEPFDPDLAQGTITVSADFFHLSEQSSGGYSLSLWTGFANHRLTGMNFAAYYPWTHTASLGWIYNIPLAEDPLHSSWFFLKDRGWFFSNEAFFPYFYDYDLEEWSALSDETD